MVSEAINSMNVSFINAAAQLEATAVSLELGEEIVNSILNLLDQVRFINIIFMQASQWLRIASIQYNINHTLVSTIKAVISTLTCMSMASNS